MLDISATNKIMFYATVWGVILTTLLLKLGKPRERTTGLPFAFILTFTAVHAGALVHLSPTYDPTFNAYLRGFGFTTQTVADGLEASCIGMIGAALGFYLARHRRASEGGRADGLYVPTLRSSAIVLLASGFAAFVIDFVMRKAVGPLAGLQAIMTTLRNLITVGACTLVLYYHLMGRAMAAMLWGGFFTVTLPAIMLVTTAILADSIELAFVTLSFYLALPSSSATSRRNILVFAGSLAFCVVFAVGYLQAREGLRKVVWGGGDIESAIKATGEGAQSFDTASAQGATAFEQIDARLNQNIFIGLAIERLRALPETFENGRTIVLAMFAWVPRILWPGKPERGGSTFLSTHTGLKFSENTTFGTGPIFELYVNFGYTGVLLGFVFLGYVVRAFDIAAVESLRRGSVPAFATNFLAGLSVMGPLADLFFIVTAIACALIIGVGLRRLM